MESRRLPIPQYVVEIDDLPFFSCFLIMVSQQLAVPWWLGIVFHFSGRYQHVCRFSAHMRMRVPCHVPAAQLLLDI